MKCYDFSLNVSLQDERFPEGLAVGGEKAQSVLGLPVVKGDGSVLGKLFRFSRNTVCY